MARTERYLWTEMRKRTLQGKAAWTGLLFIAPWILGAALFFVYPFARSLVLSVSEIQNLKTFELKWVGIQWYHDAFFADIEFVPSLLSVSIDNLINLPLINIFALIAALLLNRKIKARGLFRSIFFLPVLLGTGFIMQQLLGQDVNSEAMGFARGLLIPDQLTAYIGQEGINLIQSFLDRITTVMWNSGVQILIYLSALQSISPSLYEAAQVDSASQWESFWLITFPLLGPMIQLNLIYTIIATFSMADNTVLEFIQWLAFETADQHAYEYSCAVGMIYCIFVLLVIGIIALLTKRFAENAKGVN